MEPLGTPLSSDISYITVVSYCGSSALSLSFFPSFYMIDLVLLTVSEHDDETDATTSLLA